MPLCYLALGLITRLSQAKRMRAASRPAAWIGAEEKARADDAGTDSKGSRAACWLAGLTKGVHACNLSVKESGVRDKVQAVEVNEKQILKMGGQWEASGETQR